MANLELFALISRLYSLLMVHKTPTVWASQSDQRTQSSQPITCQKNVIFSRDFPRLVPVT